MAYGAPSQPEWPDPLQPIAPITPQRVRDWLQQTRLWPEEIAREIRELREKVEALALQKAEPGDITSLQLVQRVVLALIAAHPEALTEIEKVCAMARKECARVKAAPAGTKKRKK